MMALFLLTKQKSCMSYFPKRKPTLYSVPSRWDEKRTFHDCHHDGDDQSGSPIRDAHGGPTMSAHKFWKLLFIDLFFIVRTWLVEGFGTRASFEQNLISDYSYVSNSPRSSSVDSCALVWTECYRYGCIKRCIKVMVMTEASQNDHLLFLRLSASHFSVMEP